MISSIPSLLPLLLLVCIANIACNKINIIPITPHTPASLTKISSSITSHLHDLTIPITPLPNITLQYIAYDSKYNEQLKQLTARMYALAPQLRNRIASSPSIECILDVFTDIKTRFGSSAQMKDLSDRIDYLQYLLDLPDALQPQDSQSPADGSYGVCFSQWFWKLEISTDIFLASNSTPQYYPSFLDKVNDAVALTNHLTSLMVSDIALFGIDNSLELNQDVSNLMRLIMRGKPVGYTWRTGTQEAMMNFILNTWRDPTLSYWGARYLINDTIFFQPDLSSTFHVISYLNGNVPNIAGAVATTLALKEVPFPFGWFDQSGNYWNHNNMDIVTIISLGWNVTDNATQAIISNEIQLMLNYCLANSLQPNGQFKLIVLDDTPSTAEYFGCAFLGRIGFFDVTKRFWTTETFPNSDSIRNSIQNYIFAQLKVIPPDSSDAEYLLSALQSIGVTPPTKLLHELGYEL